MSFTALLWKDLRREARSKEALQAALALVALFFLLDLFAFPTLAGEIRAAAAVIWTPLLYASVALVGRGFASEWDRRTIDLMRSAPVPLAWHGWSRTLVHLLLSAALALATLGLGAGLFAIPFTPALLLTLGLAALGLAVTGSLASALAAQARTRDILLPILLVPVLAPLLQAGVQASLDALGGAGLAQLQVPLLLMAGYDVVALGVAWLLWPSILEAE